MRPSFGEKDNLQMLFYATTRLRRINICYLKKIQNGRINFNRYTLGFKELYNL